jgi:long-chain acyl-CoA synthetase
MTLAPWNVSGPYPSIPALIARSAARWPDRHGLWRWVDSRFEPVTYAAFCTAVARLADRLKEAGAGSEHRVAVRITDRFSFALAYLATLWTGSTAVPLDPLLTATELTAILHDADCTFLVTDSLTRSGDGPAAHVKALLLDNIWPGFASGPLTVPTPPAIDSESLAVLLFTSGTTGFSKGVMLTHANITSNILAIDAMQLLEHSDRLLSILPIHHAFESTAGFLYPLTIGAQIVYARSLKSNEILEDLRTSSATVILGVPLLFEKIANGIQRRVAEAAPSRRAYVSALRSAARAGHKLGWHTSGQTLFRSVRRRAGMESLRIIVSGGAALPSGVSEFFDLFGIPLLQGYGLSEASPVVSVNRPGEFRYDTVGPALPGIDVRIDHPGADGIGEIAVRGPMVMKGYWKRPDESAAVLKEGWLLTGDLGSIDSDRHIHVVGRSKNVIISGAGKNIYPEEVESVLNAQPGVAESMVYGTTRPGKTGELVAAIIVPDREWFAATGPEILSHPRLLREALDTAVRDACAQMAPYKRIVQWDLREIAFDKTSTRKIRRALALEQLRVAASPHAPSPAGMA